jgi:two-component system, OmpR family, sensor histidine kinase KdpD
MSEERPTPDGLLKMISSQESKSKRGKLKIFFGYAAGVGKTYAMLDAAHSDQKAGEDVVLGYIEPHSRPDTVSLAQGFEDIPVKKIEYRGIVLNEFDLDAALKRNPELILVDELAHTNAAGCRHVKRYDDIEELLSAGINVYTTLNVQHLESLNDIVASITHVTVKERVPDFVFDKATQVELVDIEPDVLIERLNAKKIYKENQAKRALNHFFTRDNLVALREIALRRIADKVNREVESSRTEVHDTPYYTSEHILVCLSSSPSNAKVIRTAARFASAFHASFTALFVETPHSRELNDNNRKRLRENLKLAEQLGAKIATVYGDDVAYQISEYAKASGVSKIVMGRSNNKSRIFLRKPNLVEKLTASAPNLDVYIIPDTQPSYNPEKFKNKFKWNLNLPDFLKTIGILTLCTLIGILFYTFRSFQINIITIFILGVLVISNQTSSKIYGLSSSVLSVLIYNYFFIEPRFTLGAYDPDYPVTFLVMLCASLITSSLTMRVKSQAKAAAVNAHRTSILLETSRKLQRANEFNSIIEKSSQQLSKLLNHSILFFPVKDAELQKPWIYNLDPANPLPAEYSSEEEYAVAVWVYHNRKSAGISTDTLPGAKSLYLPVKGKDTVLAVIGIPISDGNQLEIFERSLLGGMIYEITFAIEKYNLNEQQNQALMKAEKERLRANLLRAISHDLRTPLTSISGNASILLSNGTDIDQTDTHKLLENIYEDSLWLINLVENILAVTRIDDGRLGIQTQPELVQDLISEALLHTDRRRSEHQIETLLENDLLMVQVDAHLIVQTMINIVNNAIVYTPVGSRILIHAFRQGPWVIVEIADNGKGIPDKDKKQIFDMFYTANNEIGDSRRGLGLGLSLCKSIVNAHGGKIYVKDNQPNGTVFGFTLRLEEVHHGG